MTRIFFHCAILILIVGCAEEASSRRTVAETPDQDLPGSMAGPDLRAGEGGGGSRVDSRPDAKAIFARTDANGDGKVDGDELPSWLANNMDAFDTNGDGAVTQAEIVARFRLFRSEDEVLDASQLFFRLDADGNGCVTSDEIPAPIRGHVADIDANDNGVISAEELSVRTHLFDTNGDGVIRAQELSLQVDVGIQSP